MLLLKNLPESIQDSSRGHVFNEYLIRELIDSKKETNQIRIKDPTDHQLLWVKGDFLLFFSLTLPLHGAPFHCHGNRT